MEKKDVYDLTNPQKSIWYTEELFKGLPVNNICTSGIIYEVIDIALLKEAINYVVKQNDSFRIRLLIQAGNVKQYISDYKYFEIETQYINNENELDEIEKEQSQIKFDIIDSDLFKFKVVILKDKFACVILTVNHIISDSWSMGITIQEIIKNYHALKNNESIRPKQQSYINYIEAEKEYNNSLKHEKDKEYWNNVFNTVPEQVTLPSSSLNNTEFTLDANRIDFNIDKALVSQIVSYCKNNHFSVFSFFMAIFSIYIKRVTNSDDFVIGTPILNRTNFDEKHTTGMFVNTAPIRVNSISNILFKDFVTLFSRQIRDALKHQKYSYISILENLRQRHNNIPNLYNILISYQITKAFDKEIGNYNTKWTFNNYNANDLSIHISDINSTGNLILSYDYLINKYNKEDIKLLHLHIMYMINQVLSKNKILTNEIQILTKEEKNKLLYTFNNTQIDYDTDKNIVKLFEEQVQKTPNNTAVVFEDKRITYKELNNKANSLAFYLKNKKNIKSNDLVGIMVNRSIEMIIAILAVLKSGSAYIPIDPTYPKDRINYMLNSSKAKILLAQSSLEGSVDFHDKLLIDLSNIDLYEMPSENLNLSISPSDLAYVIFTSGSTGLPKGVMITHRVLTNFTNYCNNYVYYLKNPLYESIVSITTISFDIFFYETIISLQKGLKVVIANEDEQNLPTHLNKLLQKHNVKIIQSTPSRMQLFINSIDSMPYLNNLKYIILAGEQLPLNLVKKIHSISDITIYNGYGPSETYYSTLTKVDDKFVTIGKPIYNTQMYILDNNLMPVPIGVTGEIYISGDAVGKGYLNNTSLTKKSFITNPFVPNSIMYKTGDLGKYTESGDIICLGRSDYQVKIRGQRIELEEIENKINELPYITSCVVAKKVIENSHEILCTYYTSAHSVDVDDIKKYLEKYLPKYMIPSFYIEMPSLPYTPNGKIDRKALPDPQIDNSSKNIILPRNNTDSLLIDLLSEILQVKNISITDDFFTLGCDSLSAINLCTEVESVLNIQLHVKDIFEHSSIQSLSNYIGNLKKLSNTTQINKVKEADYYAISSAQKRMYYMDQIGGSNSILYNLPGGVVLDGYVDAQKLEKCIQTLINRHESLRTYFEINQNCVVQKILKNFEFKLEVTENANFENLDSLFKAFVKPFDLSKAPLFRAKLIQFNENKSAIFIDMHHIISDGVSLAIFTKELCKLYNGVALQDLNITYKDYAEFEIKQTESSFYKEAEKYWIDQFKSGVPVLNLPKNHINTNALPYEGKKIYSTINSNLANKLMKISEDLQVSTYMILLTCFNILLSKYSSQEDIVIGSPVVGRNIAETNNILGMFVNTLALRNNVNSELSFKELLLNIKANVLNAYKYQTYPFDELVKKLNIDRNITRNPIFNVLFTYQNNGYENIDFSGINAKYYIPDLGISKFDLSLEAIPQKDTINLSYEYATSLFDDAFIENLSNHFLNILEAVIDNIDTTIANINMLSKEEEHLLLNEFNNIDAKYPLNTTVVDLFESQVEKTPENIAIVYDGKELTYKELNEKANSLAHYLLDNGTQKNDIIAIRIDKSLEMVIGILAIIKAGCCYLPINMQYPLNRVEFMINDSNAKVLLGNKKSLEEFKLNIKKIDISLTNDKICNENTSNLNIKISPEDLLYIIYTSGSTGTPKGAMICHRNVVRLLKCDKFLFDFNESDVWTFFHSMAFDFSVWEMYGALLYGAKLVIVPDYIAKDPNLFLSLLEKEKVTVLNQTPTYFYNVINCEEKNPHVNLCLKYIIFGGEALNPTMLLPWYNLHKNTKLINMYGITETTVHVTFKELSKEDLENKTSNIGMPIPTLKILLLDNNLNLVPHGVPGEICVCGDGVFKGYLNRPELNKLKLVPNPYNKNELMYRSADIGVVNTDNSFEYLGRIDSQVKIRGFRIELGEIEEKILSYPLISSCIVINKKGADSHDSLFAYYITKSRINLGNLKNSLKKDLPDYMIPQYFIEVDSWPYNVNGKIDKTKLPDVFSNTIEHQIVMPRNDTDIKLIEIFKKLLNVDSISIDDTFFNLGGDSLSAISLCSYIENEFNTQLLVSDVLEHPEVQDISDIISKKKANVKNINIKHIPIAEFYDVSSAQKRMYFSSKKAGDNSTLYNISGGVIIDGKIDIKNLEDCFNRLIDRHESLRTYFELKDETVVQKVLDKVQFKLKVNENATFEQIDSFYKDFVKPFDLGQAPLFRAELVQFENEKSALFIDMHHIISDGASVPILTDELCKLYNGISLPELNITYKDFAKFENERMESSDFKNAENYWVEKFKDDIPVLNLPTNYSRPAVQSFDGENVISFIDIDTVYKIEQLSTKLEITPYMLLLSCYYILLSKYTGQEDFIVGSPVIGRDITEVQNLVGMFVNTLALRTNINISTSFKNFVLNVKQNVLEAFKYQAYPFDELVNKLKIKRDASRSPLFDTMFIFQNNKYKELTFSNVKTKQYLPENATSKVDLSLEITPMEDKYKISFEYATSLFDKNFIFSMSKHYLNILNAVLNNENVIVSDIDMLSLEEKNKILYEFNNTEETYPKEKTISTLFEDQVKQFPNNTAIVFEGKKLTYKQLNEKANSLAYYLRNEKNIGKNDLVGIMVNRSLEMIVAILAILKAGGAYIPIDPTYPENRIHYMLENSNAKLLLTQESLKNRIDFEYKLIIDFSNTKIYDLPSNNIACINNIDDLAYVIFTSGTTGNPKGVMLKQSNIINFIYGMIKEFRFSNSNTIACITTISFDIFVLETLMPLLNGLKVIIANEEEQTNTKLLNKLCINNNVDIVQTTPSKMQMLMLDNEHLDFIKNAAYILLGGEQFPSMLLNSIKQLSPAKIYNMYGPTETAVWSTVKDLTNTEIVTIGKPIINTQIYNLDKNLMPLPVGIPGELYISGDGVSKGYINNKELTDNAFITNPFKKNKLMYKTGDSGIYTENGDIICLGRLDNQVKIRGLRIELEEIESIIEKFPHIRKACAVKQVVENREFITAYYTSDKRITIDALRSTLLSRLPRYMVPTYFVAIDDFPYTPNGKINKKALPIPNELLIINTEKYVAPKTTMQKKLVQIWEKVLNIKPVGINDNFFELGGDSLLAMNLNMELQKISSKIQYSDIFRFPTISELEEKLNSNENKPIFSKIENLSDNYVDIIKNSTKKAKFKKWHPNGILLTGCTGFLGIHVLQQFIKYEQCNIYCLVREEPGITSETKLIQKLNYYFGNKYDNLINKRIFVLTGNICEVGFGFNQEELLQVTNSIDTVINCAANVSHFGSYSDFYNTNVKSVKYIIDFCNSFKKKLYQISTMSVSGTKLDDTYPSLNRLKKICFDESCLYVGQTIENVYVRSKFEAESYVLDAVSKGLDGYILRMGNLMPRFKDGIFQENVNSNAFVNKLLSFIEIGKIPDYILNDSVELTPVDYAAKAIYKLVTHPNKINRIFHIYNHNYIPIKKLINKSNKMNIKIESISENDFNDLSDELINSGSTKKYFKFLLNDFNNDLHLDYKFDIIMKAEFTIKYLRKTFFAWPKITNRYLIKFINLLKKVI